MKTISLLLALLLLGCTGCDLLTGYSDANYQANFAQGESLEYSRDMQFVWSNPLPVPVTPDNGSGTGANFGEAKAATASAQPVSCTCAGCTCEDCKCVDCGEKCNCPPLIKQSTSQLLPGFSPGSQPAQVSQPAQSFVKQPRILTASQAAAEGLLLYRDSNGNPYWAKPRSPLPASTYNYRFWRGSSCATGNCGS